MSDEFQDIPDRLKQELAGLYRSRVEIPAAVNQKILNDARVQLARQGRWRTARWAGAVAAAACVVLVSYLMLRSPSSSDNVVTAQRVNIVDALKLAHEIQAGKGRDVNHDGVIDQRDVDALALLAVRLDEGGIQ